MFSIRRLIGLSSVLFVLSACGGGGSSGDSGGQTPPPTYTVATSVTGSGSGSISPTSRTVSQGSTTSFTISAASGSTIASVSGCGGSLSGTTYTTGAIASNCTVTASFSATTYTVTATAGQGGSISPASASVNHGATTSFTVTPDSGHEIDSVSGCGGSLSGNTFTTAAITGNCSVSASFRDSGTTQPPPSTTFTVSTTTTGTGGGTIAPGSATVTEGETASFSVTPDAGSEIESVSGCNGSLTGNVYVTGAINVNCAVTATFTLNTYEVTAVAGEGGSISPTSVMLEHGSTTSFSVTPDAGYSISTVSGCGGSLDGTTFTTGIITGSCEARALFVPSAVRVTEYCVTNAEELKAAFSTAGKSPGRDIVRLATTNLQGNFLLESEGDTEIEIEGGFDHSCASKIDTPPTVLDGNGQGLVLVVIARDVGSIAIKDLSIINGRNSVLGNFGAGLSVVGSSATLSVENVIVRDNVSLDQYGGGMRVNVHHAEITRSHFIRNESVEGGGAFVSCQRCELRESQFIENISSQSGGGLIIFGQEVVVINNHFERNSAGSTWSGGGLVAGGGKNVLVEGNVFESNVAGGGGGASFQVEGFGGSSGVTEVNANYFSRNQAAIGGALYLWPLTANAHVRVTNNIAAGNVASEHGGGVYIDFAYTQQSFGDVATVELINNTIVKNDAVLHSGGISVRLREVFARLSLINNAVSHNESAQFRNLHIDNDGMDGFVETQISARHNAFDGADTYGAETGHPIDASNILIDASAYVDLAGGDYRPSAGSSLINAGTQTDGVPETDFTGFTRDAQPDIGAYEYRGN